VTAVELVVFDLDGTLVDSAGDLATAVNDTLRQLAPTVAPLPLERVRAFIGNGARTLIARSLAAAGLEAPAHDVLPLFLERYRACLLDTTVLYPGAHEVLDQLSGRKLAVLTNKPGDLSRTILTGLGVADRFLRVVGGGDSPTKKPDPSGLQGLIADLGTTPEATVMVGDSAIDVRTGRAAGARTVGVTYGFDPASLSVEPPDLLLDDLRQLPRVLSS
jgi:phosphoglycolate phosphatase